MKWHPHVRFAMPGVVALLFAALFGIFIPYRLRIYVYVSVMLTLVLGLITGQFHQTAQRQKARETPQAKPKPQTDQGETPK